MKLFCRPLHLHVTVQDKALPPSERRTLFELLSMKPLAELVSWVLGVKCQPWGTSAVTERGTTLEVNIDALGEEVRQYGSGGDGGRGDPTFLKWESVVLRSSHAARERIWEAIARQDLGGHNKRKRQENAPKNLTERQKNMVAAERQKLPLPALLPSQELRLLEAYVFCHIYKAAKESPHLAKWATTMKLRPHEPNASYFVDPDGSAHGLPAGLVTAVLK